MRLAGNGGPTGLIKMIKDGYDSGAWDGPTQSGDFVIPFITSDAAQGSPSQPLAIGYAEASTLYGSSGTFMTQSVDATAVLMKVTWAGDANLDGKVDVADLGILSTNSQTQGGWTEGDFNYDGTINVADSGLLSTNWQQGVGNPLGPTLAEALASLGLPSATVPEPAVLSIVPAAGIVLTRRRRS
jgi:hypothetical protein